MATPTELVVYVGRRTVPVPPAQDASSESAPPPTRPRTRASVGSAQGAHSNKAPSPKNTRASISTKAPARGQPKDDPTTARVFSGDIHERRVVCGYCEKTPTSCFYGKNEPQSRCTRCKRDHRTCSAQAAAKRKAASKKAGDEGGEDEEEVDELIDEEDEEVVKSVEECNNTDDDDGDDSDDGIDDSNDGEVDDDDIRVGYLVPTTPPAAAGSKRSRAESPESHRPSKRVARSVKSEKHDGPTSLPPVSGKPFLNSPEERVRDSERFDYFIASARMCSDSIPVLQAAELNYQMQLALVESQMQAIMATAEALAHSTGLVDSLTRAQIDQFLTFAQQFLGKLSAYRPVNVTVIQIQQWLNTISANLSK